MNSNKWVALAGAIFGIILTRTPYMQDGNLLITSVCMIFFSSFFLAIWIGYKKFLGR